MSWTPRGFFPTKKSERFRHFLRPESLWLVFRKFSLSFRSFLTVQQKKNYFQTFLLPNQARGGSIFPWNSNLAFPHFPPSWLCFSLLLSHLVVFCEVHLKSMPVHALMMRKNTDNTNVSHDQKCKNPCPIIPTYSSQSFISCAYLD